MLEVTINGTKLSVGQAMTVHVALQSFATSLNEADSLGDDDHGKIMQELYMKRIKEINDIYIKE